MIDRLASRPSQGERRERRDAQEGALERIAGSAADRKADEEDRVDDEGPEACSGRCALARTGREGGAKMRAECACAGWKADGATTRGARELEEGPVGGGRRGGRGRVQVTAMRQAREGRCARPLAAEVREGRGGERQEASGGRGAAAAARRRLLARGTDASPHPVHAGKAQGSKERPSPLVVKGRDRRVRLGPPALTSARACRAGCAAVEAAMEPGWIANAESGCAPL